MVNFSKEKDLQCSVEKNNFLAVITRSFPVCAKVDSTLFERDKLYNNSAPKYIILTDFDEDNSLVEYKVPDSWLEGTFDLGYLLNEVELVNEKELEICTSSLESYDAEIKNMVVQNIKNGNLYYAIQECLNATNSANYETMVVYKVLDFYGNKTLYVREKEEFKEKFLQISLNDTNPKTSLNPFEDCD